MARKRNCRRTKHEKRIHNKAVKLRKLTDEQLVEQLNHQFALGYQAGYDFAMQSTGNTKKYERKTIWKALSEISASNTVLKIIMPKRKGDKK